MPIMFGGFSFFFPSGLTLYILTNVCLTAVNHLVIHKDDRHAARATKTADKVADAADASGAKTTSGDAESDESSDRESEPAGQRAKRPTRGGKGKKSGKKRR